MSGLVPLRGGVRGGLIRVRGGLVPLLGGAGSGLIPLLGGVRGGLDPGSKSNSQSPSKPPPPHDKHLPHETVSKN